MKEELKGKGSITGNEAEKSQDRIEGSHCTPPFPFHIIYIHSHLHSLVFSKLSYHCFCMISPPCFLLLRILCHLCKLYAIVIAAAWGVCYYEHTDLQNDISFPVIKINQIQFDSCHCFFLSWLYISEYLVYVPLNRCSFSAESWCIQWWCMHIKILQCFFFPFLHFHLTWLTECIWLCWWTWLMISQLSRVSRATNLNI